MKKIFYGLLAVVGLVAVGCGSDSDELAAPEGGVCPDIFIQTDWYPEPEHGAFYELARTGIYDISEYKTTGYRGGILESVLPNGTMLRVAAGGYFIGYDTYNTGNTQARSNLVGMFIDQLDTLKISEVDGEKTFMVMAPLSKNPEGIVVRKDRPTKHQTIKEMLEDPDVKIAFPYEFHPTALALKSAFPDGFTITEDNGNASVEVLIKNDGHHGFAGHEAGRANATNLAEGRGEDYEFLSYSNSGVDLKTKSGLYFFADQINDYQECLKWFVPAVQQASIDYLETPAATNDLLLELVEKLQSSDWSYEDWVPQTYDYATQLFQDEHSDNAGACDCVGGFDEAPYTTTRFLDEGIRY